LEEQKAEAMKEESAKLNPKQLFAQRKKIPASVPPASKEAIRAKA
jgi:hypothetical protein